ncbi:MAG: amidohydrolase family protein [Patescibacteria group bacterium]
MAYSTIIKNGIIIDGTGQKPIHADIAIYKDKIAGIGNYKNDRARLTIDASDLYITPGFIDLATHSDNHWTLFSQPEQNSFIRQGITTILGGHGGASLFPLINKEAIQSIERWVDPSQINTNWQTTKEFFGELNKLKLTINFGTFVGHETLRRNILNNETREANKEEIKSINSLLQESLEYGAFGISTNFDTPHARPASVDEIVSLFSTIGQNNALSVHHLENEGKDLLPSISKIIAFLTETGSRGHINHIKALGRNSWPNFNNALNMIETAQKNGVQISCDFFPYTHTGSNLIRLLPDWVLQEDKNTILNSFKKETTRRNIIEHLKNLTLHYDKIIVASTGTNTNSLGRSIQKISEDSSLTGEEVILDLLTVNDLRVSIFNNIISEENIKILTTKPYAAISSDGVGCNIENDQRKYKNNLPHPRSFGTFPRALHRLVRNNRILNWETAIYKMTKLPADILGIKNRGVLQKNYKADITILDPKRIRDKATYKNPFQYPEGIEYVFVNGDLALAENNLEEVRSGEILKKK